MPADPPPHQGSPFRSASSGETTGAALWLKLAGFVALTLGFAALGAFTPLRSLWQSDAVVALAEEYRYRALLLLLLAGILSPLALLPRWPLAVVCGLIYGIWPGALLANLASTLGAWLQYQLARQGLQPLTRRLLRRQVERLQRLPRSKVGFLLAALRAFPLSNFVVTNLLAAALGIPPRTYATATFIGMLPSTLLYSSWGQMALERRGFNYGWLLLLLAVIIALAWLTRHWLKESLPPSLPESCSSDET